MKIIITERAGYLESVMSKRLLERDQFSANAPTTKTWGENQRVPV